MFGRDNLLKKEIWPRLKEKKPFFIVGPAGIGKTALLEWCFEQASGPKAMLCATRTVRENMQALCKGYCLEATNEEGKKVPISRANVASLERSVFRAEPGIIFLDEFDKCTPAFIRRLKALAERHVLVAAGKQPKKEELKRLSWGMAEVRVPPLPHKARQEMALKVTAHFGSKVPPSEIVRASRGYPARLVALSRGEIAQGPQRVEGEELDLSPVLLVGLAGLVAVRYIAVGLESTDLYILGGLGMGLGVFARFFLYRGMARR